MSVTSENLPELVDDFPHSGRKAGESWPNRFSPHDRRSNVEKYVHLGMAFAFKFVPRATRVSESLVASNDNHRLVNLSPFVLYIKSDKHAVEDWENELVLVKDVQLVEGPQGVIPSRIGLHIIDNKAVQSSMVPYFRSTIQGVYKPFPSLSNREARLGRYGNIEMSEDFCPSQIEGGSEIVQGVSEHDRQINRQESIRRILQEQLSGVTIRVSEWSVEIINKRINTGLKVSDVLLGPFDL